MTTSLGNLVATLFGSNVMSIWFNVLCLNELCQLHHCSCCPAFFNLSSFLALLSSIHFCMILMHCHSSLLDDAVSIFHFYFMRSFTLFGKILLSLVKLSLSYFSLLSLSHQVYAISFKPQHLFFVTLELVPSSIFHIPLRRIFTRSVNPVSVTAWWSMQRHQMWDKLSCL